MTKEQLLAQFEKEFPPFRGVGARHPIFNETPVYTHITQWIGRALDKYGAMEYERGRREASEAERERIGEGIKADLPPGVFEINVHKVLQVIYDTPSN